MKTSKSGQTAAKLTPSLDLDPSRSKEVPSTPQIVWDKTKRPDVRNPNQTIVEDHTEETDLTNHR